MKEQFEQLKTDVLDAITKISDRDALEKLRVEFLGRKGRLAELMRQMATLADEERKLVGAIANEVKCAVEGAFGEAE